MVSPLLPSSPPSSPASYSPTPLTPPLPTLFTEPDAQSSSSHSSTTSSASDSYDSSASITQQGGIPYYPSRSPSPPPAWGQGGRFGARSLGGSGSGSRNRSRGASPSGGNTPTRTGGFDKEPDYHSHHYQTSALLRKLGGTLTPDPTTSLITHKQRKPGWWARRAESRPSPFLPTSTPSSSPSPGGGRKRGSNRSCVTIFLAALLRQPWVPTQPLTIVFAFMVLTCFAATVTTFLIQILSVDKFPLAYRQFCSEQPDFPSALADSLAPVNVFVGVFSIDATYERRQLIRSTYARHTSPGANVVVKFILGRPRESHSRRVALEMEMYNDIVILDLKENMNRGKTFEFFKWASENATISVGWENGKGERGLGWRKVDYVVKADDDTFLRLDELERHLRVAPREKVYWGYLVRNLFMAGEVYALSSDLVTYISTYTPLLSYLTGPEDKRVSKWIRMHPSYASINLISERCWIYDHPKAGTTYSHGFLFPDEVQRIRKESLLGIEEETRLKRGGERAGAWSSVIEWGKTYQKPREGLSIEEEVEALIEGGSRWGESDWMREERMGVGMDRIIFDVGDARLGGNGNATGSKTVNPKKKVVENLPMTGSLGGRTSTKFGKDLLRDPEGVEEVSLLSRKGKRSLGEEKTYYNQVENPVRFGLDEMEVKRNWILGKLFGRRSEDEEVVIPSAIREEEEEEDVVFTTSTSSPPASPSRYAPSSSTTTPSSASADTTSSISVNSTLPLDDTEEDEQDPSSTTSSYENFPTGQIRIPHHNYVLPSPPSTRYLPPPTPRYDPTTLSIREKRMLGKKHGGTIAVHFLKRNEWFIEAALVLIGREKMWGNGVDSTAFSSSSTHLSSSKSGGKEDLVLPLKEFGDQPLESSEWDGEEVLKELEPFWGDARMYGSPIVEDGGFISVGRPVKIPKASGGQADLRVKGWKGGKLGFRIGEVDEGEGGLLIQ